MLFCLTLIFIIEKINKMLNLLTEFYLENIEKKYIVQHSKFRNYKLVTDPEPY